MGAPLRLSEVPALEAVQNYVQFVNLVVVCYRRFNPRSGVAPYLSQASPCNCGSSHGLPLHKAGLKGVVPLVKRDEAPGQLAMQQGPPLSFSSCRNRCAMQRPRVHYRDRGRPFDHQIVYSGPAILRSASHRSGLGNMPKPPEIWHGLR